MPTFLEEKERRIAQFALYLRLMSQRRQEIVKDNCFIVFDSSPPTNQPSSEIRESVAIRVGAAAVGDATAHGDSRDGPLGDWHFQDSSGRFLQFAFMEKCFYMELPNNTIFRPEDELILRQRMDFFWAKERWDLWWVRNNPKDMQKWNPLQKVYVYGDEDSAAEDMAFVFFQVWNFPIDSPLYVKAASFDPGHQFEDGTRIG